MLVALSALWLGYFFLKQKGQGEQPALIAHAGGGINGLTYMNSLEAIEHNYALGHRYFELDFSWTSDDQLVLIHDWKKSYQKLFGPVAENIPTEQAFLALPMYERHTQMTLKSLIEWLRAHPDAIVLADIKDNNIAGLKQILALYPAANQQFVAQVFHPDEYPEVKAMGYQRVVYSLYKVRIPTVEIKTFIKDAELFALAMKLAQKDFAALLQTTIDHDIFVYIQTINDIEQFKELKTQGVDGIYTDYIYMEAEEYAKQQGK